MTKLAVTYAFSELDILLYQVSIIGHKLKVCRWLDTSILRLDFSNAIFHNKAILLVFVESKESALHIL